MKIKEIIKTQIGEIHHEGIREIYYHLSNMIYGGQLEINPDIESDLRLLVSGREESWDLIVRYLKELSILINKIKDKAVLNFYNKNAIKYVKDNLEEIGNHRFEYKLYNLRSRLRETPNSTKRMDIEGVSLEEHIVLDIVEELLKK